MEKEVLVSLTLKGQYNFHGMIASAWGGDFIIGWSVLFLESKAIAGLGQWLDTFRACLSENLIVQYLSYYLCALKGNESVRYLPLFKQALNHWLPCASLSKSLTQKKAGRLGGGGGVGSRAEAGRQRYPGEEFSAFCAQSVFNYLFY